MVEVALYAEFVVCFVKGVEEVGGYDGDVDSSVVAGVAGAGGGGMRVAGANGDAVVDVLEEGGHIL